MSDFLKKFKSVFIVEEAATNNNAAPAQADTPPPGQEPASVAAPNHQSPVPGAVSDRFIEILASALEKNNQSGFDYFEFRQALANLAKMPMDEATRFKSAYAMAQTMGVTQVHLLESARFYLQVLANEQAKFNEAHAQQRAKLIGNREDEIKNLDASILQKAEQIKRLTLEIEDHQKKSQQIRNEIDESTIKIEKTKSDFDATFSSVVAQLQGDADKIKQYL